MNETTDREAVAMYGHTKDAACRCKWCRESLAAQSAIEGAVERDIETRLMLNAVRASLAAMGPRA